MSSRRIIKASKPSAALAVQLVGTEDAMLVEKNRLFNHGYKIFLSPGKILELFGERVARSKRIRKAKIREILRNAMHSIELQQGMVVDDFVRTTEAVIKNSVAEVQAMQSSPQTAAMDVEMTPVATTTTKPAAGKRKKKSVSNEATLATAMEVEAPTVAPARNDPLANQIDFLVNMLKRSDVEKASMTQRQIEKEFKKAKLLDDRILQEEQQRAAAEQKKNVKEERIKLRGRINNDIADLFAKTGL